MAADSRVLNRVASSAPLAPGRSPLAHVGNIARRSGKAVSVAALRRVGGKGPMRIVMDMTEGSAPERPRLLRELTR